MTTQARLLYQSMLCLDVDHPAVRAALADAHRLHTLVMSGFGDRLDDYDFFGDADTGHPDHRAALGIQFAVSMRADNTVRILVRSAVPPHWPPDGDWAAARTARGADRGPLVRVYTPLTEGRVRYEIRGNPARQVGRRRHELRGDAIVDWWRERAAAAGLRLVGPPTVDSYWRMRAHLARPAAGFAIASYRYTGYALIVDSDKCSLAMAAGIGRAKAYGCGMLLTTRPIDTLSNSGGKRRVKLS